ncbi:MULTISPECIES: hypothetical protein [Halorussus]|uniref:hypothetical protein n=1 Tax=Halorussus TaxID=1070314 RepID=UPI00209E88DA|nr:hypothetical protein [Halorussus vallis]USZ77221.1 hypothetical protein NGM07_07785 [Halorussus vallis]
MGIDFPKWVNEFEEQWEDKPIEYLDESGRWRKDADPLFSSISAAIQSRREISVTELQKISQWKLQGKRNDSNITQNETSEVERRSRVALQVSDDNEAIESLTRLSGVGVPLASTVLTVSRPTEYAIIDYRAFRGLAAAKPEIATPEEYTTYAEFLEHFRTYLTKAETYEYYINHIRELAAERGLSPREIDMALWAFDKAKA